ncbi:MAG TPA: ABC transporter permease [Gemmataceae bacterium]|nr:ABC transporter permease [Gemmataceae bacterium]
MHRWYPLWQLLLARLRDFYREPEAVFWVYGFPLLLAVGLGVAFSSKKPEPIQVDVQETDVSGLSALVEQLRAAGIDAELHPAGECQRRLRIGRTALYVVPETDGYRYVYDEARPEAVTARYQVDAALLRWRAGSAVNWRTTDDLVSEPGNRYIDFLMPGLMGLNIMGGGMWGVGFVIVEMRVRKLLKRLLATPMRRSDFLLSILGARLVMLLPEMGMLLLVGAWGFGMPVRGSLPTLFLVILVGASAFAGIGLLCASRAEKSETISGLMNLVMLPMWLLSGTFFSSKRFPDVAQPFIQALPLTQLNDALREVLLEGASLATVAWRLAILALWGGVGFLLALKWFRWQ